MTENEAKEMLQAKLTCMELELLSSIEKGCDNDCDACVYCYAQGTVREHKKAVEMAIQALEEIQQYRAIGFTPKMVKEMIESEKLASHQAIIRGVKLEQYEAIGTVEECRVAVGIVKKMYEHCKGSCGDCPYHNPNIPNKCMNDLLK